MAVGSPINRSLAPAWRAGTSLLPLVLLLLVALLLVVPLSAWASTESASGAAADAAAADGASTDDGAGAADGAADGTAHRYAPPEVTPGVPSAAELESAGAVIGAVLVD